MDWWFSRLEYIRVSTTTGLSPPTLTPLLLVTGPGTSALVFSFEIDYPPSVIKLLPLVRRLYLLSFTLNSLSTHGWFTFNAPRPNILLNVTQLIIVDDERFLLLAIFAVEIFLRQFFPISRCEQHECRECLKSVQRDMTDIRTIYPRDFSPCENRSARKKKQHVNPGMSVFGKLWRVSA
jgi:hypothetical protein